VRQWESSDQKEILPLQTRAVAVDPTGNVYATEYHLNRVLKFTPAGAAVSWGGGGPADESGNAGFMSIGGLAADTSGNIYVADSGANRVQKFSSNGIFLNQVGDGAPVSGNGPGRFNQPHGVAVDLSGNLYVADAGNCRIQKFSPSGAYLAQWGSPELRNGGFIHPDSVAVDASDHVYVTDGNHVEKFTSRGDYLAQWGSYGSGDGQFQGASGVAVDSSGNVYVGDIHNLRVEKFTPGGKYLTQWSTRGPGDSPRFKPNYVKKVVDVSGKSHEVHFSHATPSLGVAVDGSGNVYVVGGSNSRVQVFTQH
jgi:sugar lactone lactonase YvrE